MCQTRHEWMQPLWHLYHCSSMAHTHWCSGSFEASLGAMIQSGALLQSCPVAHTRTERQIDKLWVSGFFFPAGCCPLSASSGTTGNTLPPRWNSSCGPVFPNERSVTYTHLTIVLDLVTKTASGQVDLFTRHVPLPVGAFLLSDGFIWIFGNFIQYLADFRMDPNELFALDFLYSVKNI